MKIILRSTIFVREGHEEHVMKEPTVFKNVESVMPNMYFKELLEDQNSEIFIAKHSDLIIGFAVVCIECAPPFHSLIERKYAYIHDFGVKKKFKNKVLANDYLIVVKNGQ